MFIHQALLSSSVRNPEILFAGGASNTTCLVQLDWWSRARSVRPSEILDDSWRDIAAFIHQYNRLFFYLDSWVLVRWHFDELLKNRLLSFLVLLILKVLITSTSSFDKSDSILLHSFFLQLPDIFLTSCKNLPCRCFEIYERSKFLEIFFLEVYLLMFGIFFFFGFLLFLKWKFLFFLFNSDLSATLFPFFYDKSSLGDLVAFELLLKIVDSFSHLV